MPGEAPEVRVPWLVDPQRARSECTMVSTSHPQKAKHLEPYGYNVLQYVYIYIYNVIICSNPSNQPKMFKWLGVIPMLLVISCIYIYIIYIYIYIPHIQDGKSPVLYGYKATQLLIPISHSIKAQATSQPPGALAHAGPIIGVWGRHPWSCCRNVDRQGTSMVLSMGNLMINIEKNDGIWGPIDKQTQIRNIIP